MAKRPTNLPSGKPADPSSPYKGLTAKQPCAIQGLAWTLEALVLRMKYEILRDIRNGRVPETVTTFADLHDYVDANCYGGMCRDDCPFRADSDVDAALTNTAMDQVDEWLRAGRR